MEWASPGCDPEQLLILARQKDDNALGALLETYRKYLELLARMEIGRRLQTKLDTGDVLQETFLEAYRSFDSFRGATEADFVAWLRGVLSRKLSNLVRHYLRTKGRDLRREQPLEISLDQSSRMLDQGFFASEGTPSQNVCRREQGVVLAEALAQLPDDYREAIVLRNLEELSFPEVAQRMNKTIDSVQKLWVRGLANLRRIVKDTDG
jgi:RNA polymerase sigma-70 factor (ECF subfamily)